MDAQIYRMKQLWSKLRKMWSNSPESSRTDWMQALKDRMKPNPKDWCRVSYKIQVANRDSK